MPCYGNTAQVPPYGLSAAPADLRAKSRRKRRLRSEAPRQLEDMKEIYGMGERKFAKYGKQFFAAIEDYRREHPEAEFTDA